MVDEVKAFCPNCGRAFLDEQHGEGPSHFDRSDKTVEFNTSLFNVMLSDMGLDISKAPDPAPTPTGVVNIPAIQTEKPRENAPDGAKPFYTNWLFVGLILALSVFLLVVIAAMLVFLYSS